MGFYEMVSRKIDYSARMTVTEIAHCGMVCCDICGVEIQAGDDVLVNVDYESIGMRHTAHFKEAQ